MADAVKVYKHFQTPKAPGVYHRLICLTGERKGVAYFIMGAKRVVLGRSETCDIRLFDLKSSREHAEIMQVGDSYIITDLGSQNGIMVNDLKIKQHTLTNGDKVIIGKTVFKFSEIKVEDHLKQNAKIEKEILEEEEEVEAKEKDKKITILLLCLIAMAIVIWGSEDPIEEVTTKTKAEVALNSGVDEDLSRAIEAKIKKNQEVNEKLGRYFHRGLREFREGNFFRAYVEFENARQWNPKDPMANFYLRKTKEKQNEVISSYFSKGIRDTDALNYDGAIQAYCEIVRLLIHHIPNDQRISQARESIRLIEKRKGVPDNSVECVKKD